MSKSNRKTSTNAGMSAICKTQIIRELEQQKSDGRRTIIIDPENEYESLAKNHKKRDIIDPFSIND